MTSIGKKVDLLLSLMAEQATPSVTFDFNGKEVQTYLSLQGGRSTIHPADVDTS